MRSTRDRVVAGVAAGIADYVGVDPVLVRLAFVALTFVGGLGVALYGAAWLLVPERPAGERPAPARHAEPARVGAVGLVVLGLLLLVRELALWPGDRLVWPALLAAAGLALLWKRSSPEQRASFAQSVRGLADRTLEPPRAGRPGGAALARIVAGSLLLVAGIATFLAFSGSAAAAGRGVAAAAVVVAGLALLFLPWWRRLVRELAEERRERVRSQERAELAAHLHDSVLQTLALIQRRAGEPGEVVRLARRQERDLRDWLLGREPGAAGGTLAGALRRACEEIEDLHGVTVEPVFVGDAPLDADGEALVAATREALANAARLSGEALVSLYLEVDAERATVYVRDRGVGFDPASVDPSRRGIAESIVGRMRRHGGTAFVHSAPGSGTEVELVLPRDRRTLRPVEEAASR